MRGRRWIPLLLALLLLAGLPGMALAAEDLNNSASLVEDTDGEKPGRQPDVEEELPVYSSESMTAGAGMLVPVLEDRIFAGAFSDVAGAWYESAVETVYETGLMDGRSDGTFGAAGTLTIPHVVAIAARLHNRMTGGDGEIPDTPAGSAVPEAVRGLWCEKYYVYLANALGIQIRDLAEAFPVNRNCLRSDFVELLYAVLEADAADLPAINDVTDLPDVHPGQMPAALKNLGLDRSGAIFYFYQAGLMGGTDSYGTFRDIVLNRGQAAAVLARLVDSDQRVVLDLLPYEKTA